MSGEKNGYYHSRGLILRNRDYQEADRLITVFTEEQGKVSALARGVKKAKSSLRACTQPFCFSELFLRRGKTLDTVTQGKIIDFFGSARENITTVMYLLYIAEILDKVLPERQPAPELFAASVRLVQVLEEKGPRPIYLRWFEAQVAGQMGFAPVLDRCVSCGRRESPGTHFSIAAGGLLCADCSRHTTDAVLFLNAEVPAILRLLLKTDAALLDRLQVREAVLKQLEQFWEKYLEYHLEHRFALKNALAVLKQMMRQEEKKDVQTVE